MAEKAFILRMNISGEDRVPMGLAEDRIMIGWSKAKGLVDATDQQAIRRAIQAAYRDLRDNNRTAGSNAGSLWRFLCAMSEGDLVVVPHRRRGFYVARVTGAACFDADRVATDTAHFRTVRWLNAKKPFPRGVARSNLRHRMGAGGRITCVDATYVLPQIEEVIQDFASEQTETVRQGPRLGLFRKDLAQRLAKDVLRELLDGKMGERDFELFLLGLFEHLQGAAELRERRVDKGADLIVEMPLGRSFLSQRIAIQAKYYHPPRRVGVEAVKQLLTGMEAEDVDLGLVITTSDFTEDAHKFVGSDECDRKVELINGEYLARVVVDQGLWR